MSNQFFSDIFKNLSTPVVVCMDRDGLPVVHQNVSARALFDPFVRTENNQMVSGAPSLDAVLRFEDHEEYDRLLGLMGEGDVLQNHVATVFTHDGTPLPVSISASRVEMEGACYRVIYINATQAGQGMMQSLAGMLSTAFHLAYHAPSTDEAINNILAFAGTQTQVSRSYIFEAVSSELTSNTYEWCAAGVEPAIDQLKELPKEEYSYDEIIARGIFVTDDIRTLSDEDRAVLEPQGIKSLAIIPISSRNQPLGYVGFDDCEKYRRWTSEEIQVLRDLTDILGSLLVRRDMERGISRSLSIMQTITDNTDNIVYVNDVTTYELVFINKPLADTLGIDAKDIVGKRCWEVLQRGMEGPCGFCPMLRMCGEGEMPSGAYTWEFRNTITGKWYLMRDAIIKWIDGRDVHIETATEITHQKEYEEQLMHIASTDMLTGLYNREWGYKIISQAIQSGTPQQVSLVFADMDGLKQINDSLGHEVGDLMLKKTAETLQNSVRKSDTICRWGGDEFILLLRCSPQQAERVMDTVQRNMDAVNSSGEHPFTLSLSFGIMPLDQELGIDAVISEADKRMYENKMSKRVGRG